LQSAGNQVFVESGIAATGWRKLQSNAIAAVLDCFLGAAERRLGATGHRVLGPPRGDF
jgi:hypothetical protein